MAYTHRSHHLHNVACFQTMISARTHPPHTHYNWSSTVYKLHLEGTRGNLLVMKWTRDLVFIDRSEESDLICVHSPRLSPPHPPFHPTSPPSRGKATDGHPSKTQAFKIKRVSNRSPSSTAPCEAPIPNHKWKGGCLEIDAPKTCHRPPVSPTRAPPTHLCNSGEHGISCPTTISPHKASTDKNISKTHWFLRNR